MKVLINTQDNTIAGFCDDAYVPQDASIKIAEFPAEYSSGLEKYLVVTDGIVSFDAAAQLVDAKVVGVSKIKSEAAVQIDALDWRMTRATERDITSLSGESPGEVVYLREAVRRASTRAESELNALTELAGVTQYTWSVTAADTPTGSPPLTNLGFMKRLTAEERIAIRQAAASSLGVDDAVQMMNTAKFISNEDPQTIGLLQFLASLGLLTTERVTAILNW